jgi:hypothetical protein
MCFFQTYVTASTTNQIGCRILPMVVELKGGLGMLAQNQDLAPLLALLKMAADQWPSSEIGEVSQSEMFRRDQALLKMWPEACRRVGVEAREFPRAVIRRWQQEMSRGLPN